MSSCLFGSEDEEEQEGEQQEVTGPLRPLQEAEDEGRDVGEHAAANGLHGYPAYGSAAAAATAAGDAEAPYEGVEGMVEVGLRSAAQEEAELDAAVRAAVAARAAAVDAAEAEEVPEDPDIVVEGVELPNGGRAELSPSAGRAGANGGGPGGVGRQWSGPPPLVAVETAVFITQILAAGGGDDSDEEELSGARA